MRDKQLRKFTARVMAFIMAFSLLPPLPIAAHAAGGEIISFTPLHYSVADQTVPVGTQQSELNLPDTLDAAVIAQPGGGVGGPMGPVLPPIVPGVPDIPDIPDIPGIPEEPEELEEPSEPGEPEEPYGPEEPGEPTEPDDNDDPSELNGSSESDNSPDSSGASEPGGSGSPSDPDSSGSDLSALSRILGVTIVHAAETNISGNEHGLVVESFPVYIEENDPWQSGELNMPTTEVPVTWQAQPDFDGETMGIYVFTAVVHGQYTLVYGVEAPQITVTVVMGNMPTTGIMPTVVALPTSNPTGFTWATRMFGYGVSDNVNGAETNAVQSGTANQDTGIRRFIITNPIANSAITQTTATIVDQSTPYAFELQRDLMAGIGDGYNATFETDVILPGMPNHLDIYGDNDDSVGANVQVRPAAGLAPGMHTATLRIQGIFYGSNEATRLDIPLAFEVSTFTARPPTSDPMAFYWPARTVGYDRVATVNGAETTTPSNGTAAQDTGVRRFVITNPGPGVNLASNRTILNATAEIIDGDTPGAFEIHRYLYRGSTYADHLADTIIAGEPGTGELADHPGANIQVWPAVGLPVGVHTATLRITGIYADSDTPVTLNIPLGFEVRNPTLQPPPTSNPTGFTWAPRAFGYGRDGAANQTGNINVTHNAQTMGVQNGTTNVNTGIRRFVITNPLPNPTIQGVTATIVNQSTAGAFAINRPISRGNGAGWGGTGNHFSTTTIIQPGRPTSHAPSTLGGTGNANLSLWNNSLGANIQVWPNTGLAVGVHTATLRITGTYASSGAPVTLDIPLSFEVLPFTATAPTSNPMGFTWAARMFGYGRDGAANQTAPNMNVTHNAQTTGIQNGTTNANTGIRRFVITNPLPNPTIQGVTATIVNQSTAGAFAINRPISRGNGAGWGGNSNHFATTTIIQPGTPTSHTPSTLGGSGNANLNLWNASLGANIQVWPNTGLAVGVHTATLRITGTYAGSNAPVTLDIPLSFEVTGPPLPTRAPSGTLTWAARAEGYGRDTTVGGTVVTGTDVDQTHGNTGVQRITITNNATNPAINLTNASVSIINQSSANAFEIQRSLRRGNGTIDHGTTNANTILPGTANAGTSSANAIGANVQVWPGLGLPPGTHSATLRISGTLLAGNNVTLDVPLSFTVLPDSTPTPMDEIHSITISNSGSVITGYANTNDEIVFEMTQANYDHFRDNYGFIRGTISSVNADNDYLSFRLPNWGTWNLRPGDIVGFYTGDYVSIVNSTREYTLVVKVGSDTQEEPEVRSITIGNDFTQATGQKNNNNEIVFELTQEQYDLLIDSFGFLRGNLLAIDADSDRLIFHLPQHGDFELGINDEVGFYNGHYVSALGSNIRYPLVVVIKEAPEEIRSITIGRGDVEVTGHANSNDEVVFALTAQQLDQLSDDNGWLRGNLLRIDADYDRLRFHLPSHGIWYLEIGQEAGFYTGDSVSTPHSRLYTFVIKVE